ncbi:MAG: TRAP transporter small permease subunit [Deltaproteobacteria bacterium]|nr:TRAP transporter small permease subunit [Deltaproteobacteria bacterium]
MRTIRIVERALARIEGWFIVAFVAAMVILTLFQILLRALYTYAHIPWANLLLGRLDWGEPLARLSVLWVTFLGASLLTGENRHIKIDLLSGLLPPRWLPLREIILSAAASAVCGLMLKASLDYLRVEATYGALLFLGIPVWVSQLVLPFGFSMILFRFLLRAAEGSLSLLRGLSR